MTITVISEFETVLEKELRAELAGWKADQRENIALQVAMQGEINALRTALKNLLEDTQHAEHENCEEGPCPVREARELLHKEKTE